VHDRPAHAFSRKDGAIVRFPTRRRRADGLHRGTPYSPLRRSGPLPATIPPGRYPYLSRQGVSHG